MMATRGAFWLVVLGNEAASENRLHSKNRKETARHAGPRHTFGLRAIRPEIRVAYPVNGGRGEEIGLVRPIGEVRKRDIAIVDPLARVAALEIDDAFGIRDTAAGARGRR